MMVRIHCATVPTSPSGLTISGWLESNGGDGMVCQSGADLVFDTMTNLGKTRIHAISPFVAEKGIQVLCEPCLLRVDIGTMKDIKKEHVKNGRKKCMTLRQLNPPKKKEKSAHAWTIRPWDNRSLAAIAVGKNWISGVLFAAPGPRDVLGSNLGTTLLPPEIGSFLRWLESIARGNAKEQREFLWDAIEHTSSELFLEKNDGFLSFIRRTGEMLMFGGLGASMASYLAIPCSSLAIEFFPLIAGVGALCGVGAGFLRVSGKGKTNFSNTTNKIIDTIKSTGIFDFAWLSKRPKASLEAGALTYGDIREVYRCKLSIDGRIKALAGDGLIQVLIDIYRFVLPSHVDPRAMLIPQTWAVVRVFIPKDVGSAPLGMLQPMSGTSALGCWLTEREIERNALQRVLAPLAVYLKKNGKGPYR